MPRRKNKNSQTLPWRCSLRTQYIMKKGIKYPIGRIETDICTESESLEQQLRRAVSNKEPIKATAKVTYNDRKDGVLPQHDIRTDRFLVAMLATDKIHATKAAERHAIDFPEPPKDENGNVIPAGEA